MNEGKRKPVVRLLTCAWCGRAELYLGGRVYCPGCGHRAGIERLACDCDSCLAAWYRSNDWPDRPHSPKGKRRGK
jgi:hypothetical protein